MFGDKHRFLTRWDGPITAVARWRATPEQKASALSALKAHAIISELDQKDFDGVRILGALYTVATGRESGARSGERRQFQLGLADVKAATRDGRLLFVKGWEFAANRRDSADVSEDGRTPEEKLIRKAMGKKAAIIFEGRRYRFVLARDWVRSHRQGIYRPVTPAEASAVVEHLSRQPTNTAEQKALWGQIAERLSDAGGDREVLVLRERSSAGPAAATSLEPAVTPSQLQPKVAETIEEKDWIEVEVLYDDGSPFEGNCRVDLPGGGKKDGPLGEEGLARIDGLLSGDCKVSFSKLDSAAWGLGSPR